MLKRLLRPSWPHLGRTFCHSRVNGARAGHQLRKAQTVLGRLAETRQPAPHSDPAPQPAPAAASSQGLGAHVPPLSRPRAAQVVRGLLAGPRLAGAPSARASTLSLPAPRAQETGKGKNVLVFTLPSHPPRPPARPRYLPRFTKLMTISASLRKAPSCALVSGDAPRQARWPGGSAAEGVRARRPAMGTGLGRAGPPRRPGAAGHAMRRGCCLLNLKPRPPRRRRTGRCTGPA